MWAADQDMYIGCIDLGKLMASIGMVHMDHVAQSLNERGAEDVPMCKLILRRARSVGSPMA